MMGSPVVTGARHHSVYPDVMLKRIGWLIEVEFVWNPKSERIVFMADQMFFNDPIFEGRWDWVVANQQISAQGEYFAYRMSYMPADKMEEKRRGLEPNDGLLNVFQRFSAELQKWNIDAETMLTVGLDNYVKILRQVAPNSDFDPLTNWSHETRFRFLGKLFKIKLHPDKG